jgi:hypothetical protein
MARRQTPVDRPQSANLTAEAARAALPSLERRINELTEIDLAGLTEENGDNVLEGMRLKINATLRDILGDDSIEFREYEVSDLTAYVLVLGGGHDNSIRRRLPNIRTSVSRTLSSLETLQDILKEKATPDDGAGGRRIIRAYEGLELHAEIARAGQSDTWTGNMRTQLKRQ